MAVTVSQGSSELWGQTSPRMARHGHLGLVQECVFSPLLLRPIGAWPLSCMQKWRQWAYTSRLPPQVLWWDGIHR